MAKLFRMPLMRPIRGRHHATAGVLLGMLSCAPSVANRSAPRVDSPASTSTSPGDSVAPSSPNGASTNDPRTNDPSTNDPRTNDPRTNDPRTNDPRTNDPRANDPHTNDANEVAHGPDRASSATAAAIDEICSCLTGTEGHFELVGTVTGRLPREISEASGMVTSRFDDTVLWTHNDSGHDPVLFAVHEDGTLITRLELATSRGALTNRDFEDLAAGRCDANDRTRSCLYVGDFGDNELRAASVHVHRLREPDPRSAPARLRVETMELTFPDGARDTEAMVVDDHGAVWLLTKRPPNGRFRLYFAPFRPGTRATLTLHGEVSLAPLGMIASMSMFTAADLHPRCGLIGAYYGGGLAMRVEATRLEHTVDAELVPIPIGRGLQNETIAFTSDGYRHAAEGEGAAIHRFRCTARPD